METDENGAIKASEFEFSGAQLSLEIVPDGDTFSVELWQHNTDRGSSTILHAVDFLEIEDAQVEFERILNDPAAFV